MKCTKMQYLGMGAKEFEILDYSQKTIYVFALLGASYKKLKHSLIENTNDRLENKSIHIAYISSHFETVKKPTHNNCRFIKIDINWDIHLYICILLMGTYQHIHVARVSKCDPSISIIMHAYSFGSEK